jgi:hypothetical protein
MSEALRRASCWDLVLIGCGKSKRDEPTIARDLYTDCIELIRDPAYDIPNIRERVLALAASPSPWAFGPPAQPSVLVLAGAPYIDGWANRARAAGVLVDDPLRGYDLVERRAFARRFLAETEAWRVGEEDDRGYSRREQLMDFAGALEFERLPSIDEIEAVEPAPQLGLDLWGSAQ